MSPASPLRKPPQAFAEPREPTPPEERDYDPNGAVEWTLDLAFDSPVVVSSEELEAAFPRERIRRSGLTLYGIPADGSRWTYVCAKDSPNRWRAVAVSTSLVERKPPENGGS